MTPSSPSLCWVEVPDHGASVSVKCRHHKTVPSSHHPTWYQGYHRYLDISIYLHSDTRHLSAVPPCHNPLSRVTCHAGADADSARDIMNLSSGSCLNAPLAPALLFQCWYLQLRDGGNLKLQLFWSVHSGWAGAGCSFVSAGAGYLRPAPSEGDTYYAAPLPALTRPARGAPISTSVYIDMHIIHLSPCKYVESTY